MEAPNNSHILFELKELKSAFLSMKQDNEKAFSTLSEQMEVWRKSHEKLQERVEVLEKENSALKQELINNNDLHNKRRKRTIEEEGNDQVVTVNNIQKKTKTSNIGTTTSYTQKQRQLQHDSTEYKEDDKATFDSLSDDILCDIMELTGNCYISAGRINKRCLNVFEEYKLPKKSNVYGYGTVEEITQWYLQLRREGVLNHMYYYGIVYNTLMFNRQDFIDKMIQLQDCGLLEQLCATAADDGNMNILNNVFHKSNVTVLDYLRKAIGSLCFRAARFGYLDILKWYRSHGCEWNASVFNSARELGQDHIVEYLRLEGCPEDEDPFDDSESDEDDDGDY